VRSLTRFAEACGPAARLTRFQGGPGPSLTDRPGARVTFAGVARAADSHGHGFYPSRHQRSDAAVWRKNHG